MRRICLFLQDHYKEDVVQELLRELADRNLRINVEYHEHNMAYVSITDPETSEDCIKTCIAKGLFYAQKRREKKLHSLIDEYFEAQNEAQKKRLLIWEYGDARDDDAKEFGLGKWSRNKQRVRAARFLAGSTDVYFHRCLNIRLLPSQKQFNLLAVVSVCFFLPFQPYLKSLLKFTNFTTVTCQR